MISTLYDFIQCRKDELRQISDNIWEHPEIGYHETYACKLACDYLRSAGFQVQNPFCQLDTAFKAECSNGEGPVFAFCSEFDALAGLGHGCGHNLICTAGIGAFYAAAQYMKEHNIPGKLVLLGCPAEESYGGKVKMDEAGCLEGIDAVIMAHPGAQSACDSGHSAAMGYEVTFHGKAAHAGGSPSKGINALDATMLLFAAINAYRQQMPDTARIHGIVTNGGDAPNIIPATSTSRIYLRSMEEKLLEPLQQRFLDMVKGAELMTHTTADVSVFHLLYRVAKANSPMNLAYSAAMEELGEKVLPQGAPSRGSTDFGNFSQKIPGCHFNFGIVPKGQSCPGHSTEFKEAAHGELGFQNMLKAAAAMASVAIDYLTKPEFRSQVRQDFETK